MSKRTWIFTNLFTFKVKQDCRETMQYKICTWYILHTVYYSYYKECKQKSCHCRWYLQLECWFCIQSRAQKFSHLILKYINSTPQNLPKKPAKLMKRCIVELKPSNVWFTCYSTSFKKSTRLKFIYKHYGTH